MPLDLAALAVEAGAVPAEDMQRALVRQRETGGALETALLELGLLGEPEVTRLLARASGLPCSPRLVPADLSARNVLPVAVARRHRLVPFRLEGRQLSLVAAHPVDLAALDEVSFMLSLHVVPHVAPEWRVAEAMATVYGIPMSPRLAALAGREPPPVASVRAVDAGEPRAAAARAAEAFDATALLCDVIEVPPVSGDPPGWSLRQAAAALDAAHDRDEALAIVLRYARNFVEAAAIFAVTRDGIVGLDGAGWENARARCRSVQVAPDAVGLFRAAVATRGPYLGPIGREPGNGELLRELRRRWPATALAYPVVVRDRVVSILYADNGEAPISAQRIGDLLLFAGAVGAALERIVRDAKTARRTAPRPEVKDEGGWVMTEPARSARTPSSPPDGDAGTVSTSHAVAANAPMPRSG